MAGLTLTSAEERLLADLGDDALAQGLRERGLPNRRVEEWRWSDIRGALKEARGASAPFAGELPEPPLSLPDAVEIIIVNGRLAGDAALPEGVTLTEGAAKPMVMAEHPVAALATASSIRKLTITDSQPLPLVVRRLSDGSGAHADRLDVVVEEGVNATLIETHEVSGNPFTNSLTMLHLKAGTHLTRVVVQPAAPDAVVVHTSMPALEKDARLDQTSICLGATLARHETAAALMGPANARFDALYRLDGKTHNDFTTHVDHMTPGSTTRALCKGVVGGNARGVFQGKFLVRKEAQQTDARMGHHSLLLSAGATVQAKPELEIYADDVECAHGNTAGALDAEALFYMRQRGLNEAEAAAMLVDAFAAEVLDRIEDEPLRAAVTAFFHGKGVS